MAMFCGHCGAQVPVGAPFCGRCGAPVVAPAVAAAPVYSYPVAAPARYPARRFATSQIAIAGVLLAILAIVTVGVTALAVSQAIGGSHATCTVNCAPKIVTPLPESKTYRSSAFKYEVDYSSAWTVRSEDANGILLGTRLGTLEVVGSKSSLPLDQALKSAVAALPSAQWQMQFAVIAATRGGMTVVILAADPADLKGSPHGIPEAQDFDYLCAEFRWP